MGSPPLRAFEEMQKVSATGWRRWCHSSCLDRGATREGADDDQGRPAHPGDGRRRRRGVAGHRVQGAERPPRRRGRDPVAGPGAPGRVRVRPAPSVAGAPRRHPPPLHRARLHRPRQPLLGRDHAGGRVLPGRRRGHLGSGHAGRSGVVRPVRPERPVGGHHRHVAADPGGPARAGPRPGALRPHRPGRRAGEPGGQHGRRDELGRGARGDAAPARPGPPADRRHRGAGRDAVHPRPHLRVQRGAGLGGRPAGPGADPARPVPPPGRPSRRPRSCSRWPTRRRRSSPAATSRPSGWPRRRGSPAGASPTT